MPPFQTQWAALAREVETLVSAVREKGAKRFGRAFGAAGFMIFASYWLLYRPPQAKSERLDAEIARAKKLRENADQYQQLRDQLQGAYSRLPRETDREQWLFNSVRESVEKSGLVTDDIKSVQEQELNGLVFQSLPVSLNLKFAEFYDWLLRLENARPMMHVSAVDISKKGDIDASSIGYNSTSCSIATVIPKKRFQ